jgi:hypothetical protein
MDAPYYALRMILLYLYLANLSQQSRKLLMSMPGSISGVELVAFYFQQ